MRKILLASTAIVALSAGSAMASDITISGSFEFGYNDDSVNSAATALTNNDGTSYGVEQDVNINFSSTTDSGLTMTTSMGLHEDGNNDDLNATLSGDFGTLKFVGNGADDDAVEGMDIDVAAATSEEGTAGSDTPTYAGGFTATAGTSVSYTLPTLMEGLTIAAASANGGSDADSTGLGATYAMTAGGASVKLAVASGTVGANATADVTQNHYGISITSGAFTVMAESNSRDDGTAADFSSTGIGGTYTMGAMKFGAFNETASTGTATQDYSRTAWGVDYTIAAGLTASITQTSTDVSSTISTDRTRASLKMAF